MVNLLPSIASLLAFGQAITVVNAVSSFSESVDGILENPQGDHMSPETVIEAFRSGNFSAPPAAGSLNMHMHLYLENSIC